MCIRYAKHINKEIEVNSNATDLGYCHNCDFEYNNEHEVPDDEFGSICPNCGDEGVRTFYVCPEGHAYDPNYPEDGESGFGKDQFCPHN